MIYIYRVYPGGILFCITSYFLPIHILWNFSELKFRYCWMFIKRETSIIHEFSHGSAKQFIFNQNDLLMLIGF